jgi:hypothetical protein
LVTNISQATRTQATAAFHAVQKRRVTNRNESLQANKLA